MPATSQGRYFYCLTKAGRKQWHLRTDRVGSVAFSEQWADMMRMALDPGAKTSTWGDGFKAMVAKHSGFFFKENSKEDQKPKGQP